LTPRALPNNKSSAEKSLYKLALSFLPAASPQYKLSSLFTLTPPLSFDSKY
jgi:hypothetical protein